MNMMSAAGGEGDDRLREDFRLRADFDLLQAAVRDAGELALSYFGREIATKKKADGSSVSEADFAVDAMLTKTLMQDRPSYGWLSEETPDNPRRLGCRFTWIIDPIDGTNSFLAGQPEWTIAAALADAGQPVLAVVFNPATSEMYVARRGHGAFLNNEAITVQDRDQIEGASMIIAGGLFKKKIWSQPWPEVEVSWVNSIAYRMARIAGGTVHATISPSPKSEWDLAAPTLLVQEAGGSATAMDGSAFTFNQPVPRVNGLVAGGRALHQLLVERTKTIADIG